MHIIVNTKKAPPIEKVGRYLKITIGEGEDILIPLLFVDFAEGLVWNDPEDPYPLDLNDLETTEPSEQDVNWELVLLVDSESRPGKKYKVEKKKLAGEPTYRCDCPQFIFRKSQGPCKHIKEAIKSTNVRP